MLRVGSVTLDAENKPVGLHGRKIVPFWGFANHRAHEAAERDERGGQNRKMGMVRRHNAPLWGTEIIDSTI